MKKVLKFLSMVLIFIVSLTLVKRVLAFFKKSRKSHMAKLV